jgi:hypothetical protein
MLVMVVPEGAGAHHVAMAAEAVFGLVGVLLGSASTSVLTVYRERLVGRREREARDHQRERRQAHTAKQAVAEAEAARRAAQADAEAVWREAAMATEAARRREAAAAQAAMLAAERQAAQLVVSLHLPLVMR